MPTGAVSLMLSFGPGLRVTNASMGGPVGVSSFVVGMYDEPALVEHDGCGNGVQIDLTAAGAYALLGLPMHELANRVVPAHELGCLDVDRLVDRMLEYSAWQERFWILDEEVAAALALGPSLSPQVAWVDRQLRSRPQGVRIGALAAQLGWSRGRLVEGFRREVGLPPKTVARVLRFRRAVDRLSAGRPLCSLAEVAAECGYSDQPHLNREFREFAGCTPTEFVRTEQPRQL
jgi:AraC-like DNA-binding protein